MIKKINTKGISHIEVVISFVIFIGFVLFLLLFLKPVRNKEVSYAVLDSVQRGIEAQANTEYSYVSLKINEVHAEDFYLDFLGVGIASPEIIIRNETGDRISGKLEANSLYVKGGENEKFYIIYYSPEFKIPDYSPADPVLLEDTEYSIGLLRKNNVLFYSKIYNLNESYYNDYENLKTSFRIPASNDFGFIISTASGESIFTSIKKQPPRISIIARDIPSQILNETGDIRYVVVNMQAW